ncbi:MAG: VCBS repeat-containing protein [Deltaproteobacteria bacterium]|nr:VCBS repeat-containing protein [Deltaproteobacteria bacterium]
MTDTLHCGRCTSACPARGACVRGSCACPSGTEVCDNICVDLASSRDHCGACGRACPEGTACASGRCQCLRPGGQHCGGQCVDLARNTAHCGRCENACSEGAPCVDGRCTPRLLTPAVGARLGGRRPVFRWSDGDATVELCAERSCSAVVLSLRGSTARGARPSTPLLPGVYFWRLRPPEGAPGAAAPAVFRVDARNADVPGILPTFADLDGDGLKDIVVLSARTISLYPGVRRGSSPGLQGPFPLPSSETRLQVPRIAGSLGPERLVEMVVVANEEQTYRWQAPRSEGPVWTRVYGRVIPIADVNNDGWMDWLGGLPASVHYGGADPLGLVVPLPPREVEPRPESVAQLGDVNGDGFPDVARGSAEATSPVVSVHLGGSLGLDRVWALSAGMPGEGFGATVSSAGDVNGDGYADVLAGLGEGRAVLFLGGPEALRPHRLLAAEVPLRVASAGDVDGDGYGELLGLPRGRPEVLLFRGSREGLVAEPVVLGDPRWAHAVVMGEPGDVDGDGTDDVVLGAPSLDEVYVLYGSASHPLLRVDTLRGEPGSDFGRAVL